MLQDFSLGRKTIDVKFFSVFQTICFFSGIPFVDKAHNFLGPMEIMEPTSPYDECIEFLPHRTSERIFSQKWLRLSYETKIYFF